MELSEGLGLKVMLVSASSLWGKEGPFMESLPITANPFGELTMIAQWPQIPLLLFPNLLLGRRQCLPHREEVKIRLRDLQQ